jgi:hypothetical protein
MNAKNRIGQGRFTRPRLTDQTESLSIRQRKVYVDQCRDGVTTMTERLGDAVKPKDGLAAGRATTNRERRLWYLADSVSVMT